MLSKIKATGHPKPDAPILFLKMGWIMIEAVITGVVAIIVCTINSYVQSRRNRADSDKHTALMDYRMQELTKQVEKHNCVIERTYALEEARKVHEEKFKVVNHRIDDLEGK